MNFNPSKSPNDLSGVLFIQDLVIPICIGVTAEERGHPQNISINLELTFKQLPNGCYTDKISDTICYHSICQELINNLKYGKFNLVEKLTSDIYQLLSEKSLFSKIKVSIKKWPKIDGLNGYVMMDISNVA